MARNRPGELYIRDVTPSQLLTGENACEWAGWFRAHHRSWTKHPSDFDPAARMQERTGYEVYTGNRNLFRIFGATATIAGKPGLIGEKRHRIPTPDAKTGSTLGTPPEAASTNSPFPSPCHRVCKHALELPPC